MSDERDSILTGSSFKKEKLFHLLHTLQISRASLLIEDENIEFIDLSNKDHLEYQLFTAGDCTTNYTVEHQVGKCPICNTKIVSFSIDEDIIDHITEDYKCIKCGFQGTQWINKLFIGHTCSVPNQTIESYRNQHN